MFCDVNVAPPQGSKYLSLSHMVAYWVVPDARSVGIPTHLQNKYLLWKVLYWPNLLQKAPRFEIISSRRPIFLQNLWCTGVLPLSSFLHPFLPSASPFSLPLLHYPYLPPLLMPFSLLLFSLLPPSLLLPSPSPISSFSLPFLPLSHPLT